MKVPLVEPSVVLLSDVVGVVFVLLQQIPDEVIADPPFELILAPETAAYLVMLDATVVDKVGAMAMVVKLISVP